MKFKEIKPGMVIHCPKEEDARVLLEHLESLGYVWNNGANICAAYSRWHEHCNRTGYQILLGDKTRKITNGDVNSYLCKITEFSDLIEPDEPQMSAVEALSWLKYNRCTEACKEVFGTYSAVYVIDNWSPEEIVKKITAYEAAKKAPKPVEVEWVDICRIIQIQDNGFKKCVYEEELPDNNGYATTENILKKYISEHEGQYIAVIEGVCRVKEDK